LLTQVLFIQIIDTTLLSAVADMQQGDSTALKALQLITRHGTLDLLTDVNDWSVETDSSHSVLFYKGKIYIPDNLELRRTIVQQFHDTPTTGHPSILGTFQAISKEQECEPLLGIMFKIDHIANNCHVL
jgi:hypothetical protein